MSGSVPRAAARVQPLCCTATARMAAGADTGSLTMKARDDGLTKQAFFLPVCLLMRAVRSVAVARVCARVLVCAVEFRTTHPAECPRRGGAHTSWGAQRGL